MANISTLSARVALNADAFDKVTTNMEERYKRLGKTLGKPVNTNIGNSNSKLDKTADTAKNVSAFGELKNVLGSVKGAIAAVGVALAAIGAKALVSFIMRTVDAAIATRRLANSLGDTYNGLTRIQQAMRNVGGDTDSAGRALTNLVHTLQNATRGDSALANTLSSIGLSASELAKKRPSEALADIARELLKIENINHRAAKAAQIFGDEAANILPILDQLAGKVNVYGNKASDDDLRKLEKMRIAWQNMQRTVEGVALQIATAFAPVVAIIAEDIRAILASFDEMGNAGAGAADIFTASYLVATQVIAAFKLQTNLAALAVYELAYANVFAANAASGLFSETLADLDRRIGQSKDNIRKNFDDMIGDEPVKKMQAVRDKIEREMKGLEKGAKAGAAGGLLAQFAQEGLQVERDNLSPFEKYQNELQKLEALLSVGAISWDTYGRAANKAAGALEDALGMNDVRLPSFTERGSSQAASLIARSRNERELSKNESPQKRIERLQTTGNEHLKRIEEYSRDTAEATANRKVVTIQ